MADNSANSGRADRVYRYVVITPARDEAAYIEQTISSMVAQTVRPIKWILVNDGSTDATGEIIDRWAAKYEWIAAVHLEPRASNEEDKSRGSRAVEAKEIKAFYQGYFHIENEKWDFLVKLDADLGLDPDYFEKCLAEFDVDPKLGIGGGAIWNVVDGELKHESTPKFHVRGATKIYRRACWEQIGGVIPSAGWDTLDLVKANMLGWSTRSFNELRVVHYRFTGAANGAWKNAVKNGLWSYIAGYHPLYMLTRSARSLLEKPVLLGSFGLLYGFLSGYLKGVERVRDTELIGYLREQQLRRLSFRSTIWR